MTYGVYILQSGTTGRSYIDQRSHLADRLARHQASRTAVTRGRGPWRLAYSEEYAIREAAVRRERAIRAHKSHAYIATLCGARRIG